MEAGSTTSLKSNKYKVGWCGLEPDWLQPINKASWVLTWLFFANLVQSFAVNGLVGVVLSTLERRFGFTSTESSWIPGVYDAAGIPVIIYLSYAGTRMHRPRWMFLGELIAFAGTLLFVLPHFTTDTYLPNLNQTDDYVCDIDAQLDRSCGAFESTTGSSANTGLQGYLAVFILARILQGIGAQPLLMLGTTFLDDVTSKERFSLYVAIFAVGAIIGPAIAYVLGGYALTIYTDFYQVDTDSLGITPVDARWVGAWWLDFLASALCIFIFSIPFSLYARDLPGAAEIRASKVSEAHNDRTVSKTRAEGDESDEDATDVEMRLADVPSYLKTILTNPSYVCMVVYGTCDMLLIAGFTAFGPKYIETQFSQSPTIASMLFGIVSIPGGVGGSVLGGWLIKRFKLSVSSILKWLLALTILTICCVPIFILQCDAPPFAGVTAGYNNTELNGTLAEQACFSGCGCTNLSFSPVCGADNILYFSPCHAGCLDSHETMDAITYHNCSCVTSHKLGEPDALAEPCVNEHCAYFVPFLVLFLFAMFFIFTGDTMIPTLFMRLVPSTHRTMGLGLSSIVGRLLGGLTGPLLFGMAFDNACELWDDNCGERANCLTYSRSKVSWNITAICAIVKVISLIVIIIGWRFYKPPSVNESLISERRISGGSTCFTDSSVVYDNKALDEPTIAIVPVKRPNSYMEDRYARGTKRGSYRLST